MKMQKFVIRISDSIVERVISEYFHFGVKRFKLVGLDGRMEHDSPADFYREATDQEIEETKQRLGLA